jgi:hypothetical protein
MAIPTIKATYSRDAETTALLDRLARRWAVSKSEALRRLIREGAPAAEVEKTDANSRLDAFDRAQRSLGLTERVTAAWARHVRAERKAEGWDLSDRTLRR